MATTGFWLDASVNRMGGIAFTGSDASWPTQYSRGIAEMELGWSEEVRWTSGDGTKNDGVVTYPPDFVAGKKYPLVLYIHGGPRSALKVAFSNFAQLFSAQGWGCLNRITGGATTWVCLSGGDLE